MFTGTLSGRIIEILQNARRAGAADPDGDGYTNVEEYLNGTNPRERIDYTNLGNNIDTISLGQDSRREPRSF